MMNKLSLNISDVASTMRSVDKTHSQSSSLVDNPTDMAIPVKTLGSPVRQTHCTTGHRPSTEKEKLHLELRLLEKEFLKDRAMETSCDTVKEAVLESDRETSEPSFPRLRWCPFCQSERSTKVSYQASEKTLWSSLGIFMLGGVFGCFLLPFMSDYCKSIKMVCSKCDHRL